MDEWRVVLRAGGERPRFVFLGGNPLGGGIDLSGLGPGATGVCWSGTLGAELFGRDWGTWGGAGMEALGAFCARVAPELESRGARLVLRPHARHVLSDPFRCRRFLDEHGGRGVVGVALDAASMTEGSMLGDAQDHAERAFEMLGPAASAVFVTGVERGAGEELSAVSCPVGRGAVGARFLGGLVRTHVPARTPLLLMGRDVGGQLAALGLEH